MSMSRKKCCVPGCIESGRSHQTLHLFPNPAKDIERFNVWVSSIGGDIIGLDNEDIYKHRSVCHVHFEEKFCCRFNRLSNIAVPTLNLPGPLSLPKFTFDERRPLRQVQHSSSFLPIQASSPKPSSSGGSLFMELPPTLVAKDKSQDNAAIKENIDPVMIPLTSAAKVVQEIERGSHAMELPPILVGKNESPNDAAMKENIDPVIIPPTSPATVAREITKESCRRIVHGTKIVKKRLIITPQEQKLRQKLIKVQMKLSKCRSVVKKQSASIKAAKKITSNPALLATMEKLPSTAKILTMMQFREIKKKNKGRRFTIEEKILALSILKQTPKGYRFMRKVLILPAPQTLAKLISQADIKPGTNKKVFSQLKNVAEQMKMEERLCILLFDEMSLKANITYNERKDKAIGFVTDGKETKPDFADHAQVFMIRGLFKNYKQPISYSFSKAATSGQEIAKQIKEIVTELQEAGLIVVSTVCDQGVNNRQAIKLLLQETRGFFLRNGQNPKENVLMINNQEVVPLYDPPHLLKCIRNNLLTKDLEYTQNENRCTAKWQHLLLLHKENPGYKGMRLLPKLTDNHVLPEKLAKNKMKVKFASQVFSRSVATSMGYLADKGVLPMACRETADLLLFFDNLFDSLNGSYKKKNEKFAKPLLGPVTPKSVHHENWAKAKKLLKSMKFINLVTKKVENVPTLTNWVWTLDGIEVLLKKIEVEFKITSVWMRHLNQDPIENFFGAIRSHGCRNTNPTPEKFESAFTTLLINNMSSVYTPSGGNCEKDYCKNLHALIVNDDCYPTSNSSLDHNISNIIIEDVREKKDPRIMGPLQYVSGYFIRNVKKKVFKNCDICKRNVIATEADEYIKYREYAGRQWLCSPTKSVLEIISALQDIANTITKEYLHKNNLKELIKTYVLIFIEFDFLECEEHKEDIISYLLNAVPRFFLHNYCKDLNKILSGKRDCIDDEDKNQINAKKYYQKCCKRKLK